MGLLALYAPAACRVNPECFGANECSAGLVCVAQACVRPDATVPDGGEALDAAAPTDAGFADSGLPVDTGVGVFDSGATDLGPADLGSPDAGSPDAQRPDLGFPDASFEDAGFLTGPQPAARDPLVGTSTPAAVANGFVRLEGAAWRARDGRLVVADPLADALYSLDPANGHAAALEQTPAGAPDGVAYSPVDGTLLLCEQLGRRVSAQPGAGGLAVPLADSYFQHALNSPNDLAVRSDGLTYFTDPPFGLAGRPRDLPFNGLFSVDTGGGVTLHWAGLVGLHAPDGLALSPAEDRLYMVEVGGRMVLVFDVLADGALTNRRGLAVTHGVNPNGLAVDDDGNVYVATSIGVEVFAPNGYYWGFIPVPQAVHDVAFGGPSRQRLYATTTATVYVVDVPVPGPLR